MANLTLIMQNYNAPLTKLVEAIDSVVGQTYKDFNFMFIDDWSTDYDVKKYFEEWERLWNSNGHNGKIFLVIKPQSYAKDPIDHNHGHSFCRNWGLDCSQTEYVMFMDSDDMLREDAIDILWTNMQQDPKIDISIGNMTRDILQWYKTCDYVKNSDSDDRQVQRMTYTPLQALDILCDPYMLPDHKMRGPSVPFCATWNKIFRKSLFTETGIRFPSGKTKDDNFTAHRLLYNAKKICFTTEVTYFYRPGGKLADTNLYKTKDIIHAHLDRVGFFDYVFGMPYKDDFRRLDLSEFNEFEDEQSEIKIYYNEYMVMLYTYMMYISRAEGLSINERKAMAEILREKLMSEFKELMLYEPKFVKMVMEFIEKVEKLNE